MDSIITRICRLAEPAREKPFRHYLGTLPERDLRKKLTDLEADAFRGASVGNWRAGLRRAVIKIS